MKYTYVERVVYEEKGFRCFDTKYSIENKGQLQRPFNMPPRLTRRKMSYVEQLNLEEYINGVLNNSEEDTTSTPWKAEGEFLVIGAYNSSYLDYQEFFNGTIDQVKVFNISLTAAQIRNMYEVESSGRSWHTLVFNETTRDDEWMCSVTPNDGYFDGITKNSSGVVIDNGPPTQSAPTITPASPNVTSNITCN